MGLLGGIAITGGSGHSPRTRWELTASRGDQSRVGIGCAGLIDPNACPQEGDPPLSGCRHPLGRLSSPEHPFHGLFNAVADRVAGVSCGCATVFGAADEAERNGFDLVKDNPVPGTPGLPSLRNLVAEGYSVLTF
ncbi:MAG: hypothetical protein AB7R55_16290 [Gemmatimonadales bacterium]